MKIDIRAATGKFMKWRAAPIQTLACLLVGAAFFIGIAMKDPRTPAAPAWGGMLMAALSLIFVQVRIQHKGQSRPERSAAFLAEVAWTFIIGASLLLVFGAVQVAFSEVYSNAAAADWELAWQWTLGIVAVEVLYFTVVHSILAVRAHS